MRVHQNSHCITKEKKMTVNFKRRTNKSRRVEPEVGFAMTILENVNLSACHMLITVHSPHITCICVQVSPPLPATSQASLSLSTCTSLFFFQFFQIFKEINSIRLQKQSTHSVLPVKHTQVEKAHGLPTWKPTLLVQGSDS